MECWICRENPADSREHIPKAANLRSYFPQISKDSPIFKHTDETDTSLSYRINSSKSNYLKLGYSICQKCNNELTQPYDYAWDILREYLQSNWEVIVKRGYF